MLKRCTLALLVILAAIISTCQSSILVSANTAQKSSLGCSTANYMLTNSIPKSCNAALERITGSLLNSSLAVDSGDICTSYCLTPLKQAALECQDIADIYNIISLRCCLNDSGQKCFSLSGHAAMVELIAECGYYNFTNTTAGNCSTACSEAMMVATESLGCCLPGLLAGFSHQSLLELALWEWCSQDDDPRKLCTHCSGATTFPAGVACGQVGLVALVAAVLTGTLQ